MSYMKRTDKQNPALPNSGVKPKKAAPPKISKTEVSALSKKKTGAAEITLKTVKSQAAAKVSAPLPKAKKSSASKASGQAKPTARKKTGVLTKAKNTENEKTVITAKASISALKSKKTAASSDDKFKNKKAVQPISVKSAKTKKEQILPTTAAGKKSKTTEKKAEIVVFAVKRKNNQTATGNKNAAPVVAAGSKSKTNAAKINKKAEVVVPAKNQKLKTKSAAAQKKPAIIPVATNQKAKGKVEKASRKVEIPVPITKPKSKKKTETSEKKMAKPAAKKTEKKIEIVVPPVAAKIVKKKLKPIGSAVVRGKSGKYDFEVFPLDADLKDGSAIYVISKRVTDLRGRGHHKFVCIGQTESLLGEIKRHKKDKCIKQHKANVICLLREESAANRLKIETDLREAHSIACNQK